MIAFLHSEYTSKDPEDNWIYIIHLDKWCKSMQHFDVVLPHLCLTSGIGVVYEDTYRTSAVGCNCVSAITL